MSSGNRYRNDPRRLEGKIDLYEYIEGQERRLGAGETGYRAGHTAIEDGNFIVRNGDILVSESDDSVVLRIFHGALPAIAWYPLGEDASHLAAMFGFDQGAGTTAFVIEIEDSSNGEPDGGQMQIWQDGASYGFLSTATGLQSFMWLNALNNNEFYFNGRFENSWQFDPSQAIYPGIAGIGAGFGGFTHTYFAPFASTAAPVLGLLDTAGTVSWNFTAVSNSGFTISWSGTTAKTVYYWIFRL